MNEAPEIKPLPPAPPNLAALAAGPFFDGVHVRMKLNFDVTHLSEDKQKLLLHMATSALIELEKVVNKMDRIIVAAKLANIERFKSMKGNGQ